MRFLRKNEYEKCRDIIEESFGKNADNNIYFEKEIYDNEVAVYEENNEIISCVHLKRILATFENGEKKLVWYMLYACTKEDKRQKGYLKKLVSEIIGKLKNEGEDIVFLVAKNKEIWKKLGFIYEWKFNVDERDLLLADDELFDCSGMILNDKKFLYPIKLEKVHSVYDFKYDVFDSESIEKNINFFKIRPNKTFDSTFIELYLWKDAVVTYYNVVDERCMYMYNKVGDKYICTLPYCDEKDLLYYFRLQEKYFYDVLNKPFSIYDANIEAIEILKKYNALDNYDIKEDEGNMDYIYDAELMRSLAGKKYEKKRNRYHHFVKEYGDRYQYKKLDFNDVIDIKEFLSEWECEEETVGSSVYVDTKFTAQQTLDIEYKGILNLLKHREVLDNVNIAGIYIDNKLKAFAIGCYNDLERMVVLSVLKADRTISGLYQAMMKEYLSNEFIEAKIVNLEDDAGVEGLRTLKMRYNPIMFAKRYILTKNTLSSNSTEC